MRKITFIIICVLSFFSSSAQINANGSSLSSFSHNFIPSSFNANDINPSDIPSLEVLRSMGFSEKQINEITKYKNGNGKYNIENYKL